MSYSIGNITVPSLVSSGLTFPLVSDFGYSQQRMFPTITHRLNEYALLGNQTFAVGIGPRKFAFQRSHLSFAATNSLKNFFESMQGGAQTFTYNVPNPDGQTTTAYTVVFENAPITFNQLVNLCQAGMNFIEVPTTNPSYTVSATDNRFPDSTLTPALLSQMQQLIPMISIQVRNTSVPTMHLSDRLCEIGGTQYLPRILNIGEQGSGVIMSQTLSSDRDSSGGGSDSLQFTLANGDRVMTQVMNNCDLQWATVKLSFYHVNTGIVLNLWQGYITSAQSDGTAKFSVQCSDGLFNLMQLYPIRTVSRRCWKLYDDGINCPFSTQGLLNTTVFPSATSSSCDRYFDSANGCQAHGMDLYFGGMVLNQQSVVITDKGTGNVVTSTSIISDTIVGQPLPEIWCNNGADPLDSFIANGMMFAARDDSTFLDCAAIIGAGPIGGYTITGDQSGILVNDEQTNYLPYVVAPTTDGLYPQGFKLSSSGTSTSTNTDLGIRQVVGNDPIPSGDQGYEQFGLFNSNQPLPAGWPSGTATERYMSFAAGTAFVELTTVKSAGQGITPSVPEAHSITVPIAQGLTGWTFDQYGNRTAVGGLTNPVWIAINTWFRALGIQNASAATQLSTFVLSSVFVGDGTGAAEICDLSVPAILGTGDETQFQFMGSIGGQQKPTADWLQEILNVCLGYYLFENGQLKIGIRENASAVSAFTVGNMLYQSLVTRPIQARFEKIILSYADVDYQFQQNTAEVEDYDHETYYNRSGAPLTANMNSVGICTLDQALRVTTTRLREEVGGVIYESGETGYISGSPDYHEYAWARTATWGSTILALGTEVGQVVSITHPDIPGTGSDNTMNFRITGWKLMQDWSIQFTGKTVQVSMYDLDYGPKPVDVSPSPIPVLFYPQPLGQWMPWTDQYNSADALFPSERTFDAMEVYTPNADGSATATFYATGLLPVNNTITGVTPPDLSPSAISWTSTGGHLAGGEMLKAAVCCINTTSQCSPLSNVIVLQVPTGTNTNQFTLSDIRWPDETGMTDYVLFISPYDDLMCGQPVGALTASTETGVPYTPTSFTFGTALETRTFGPPNPNIAKIILRGKLGRHFGVAGTYITSVGSFSVVVSAAIGDSVNYTGRVLMVIGRPESSIPCQNYNITAFNSGTGTFTLDRDPTGVLDAGDVIAISMLGYDNSATPYDFTDSAFVNGIEAGEGSPSGMIAGAEVGMVFRVISGTSRGTTVKITANTATGFTFDNPIVLDATSVCIVEDATWTYASEATAVNNTNIFNAATLKINVSNFIHQPLVIAGFVIDVNGVESPDDGEEPIRLVWISGAEGEAYVPVPFAGWQAAINAAPQNTYPS